MEVWNKGGEVEKKINGGRFYLSSVLLISIDNI